MCYLTAGKRHKRGIMYYQTLEVASVVLLKMLATTTDRPRIAI